MKVYVAGPMRGRKELNFPAFRDVAAKLRAEGHFVFSPAEMDNERHGADIGKGNTDGDEGQAVREHGFNLREALGVDMAWICAEAEAIALLPGWPASKGATASAPSRLRWVTWLSSFDAPTLFRLRAESCCAQRLLDATIVVGAGSLDALDHVLRQPGTGKSCTAEPNCPAMIVL